MKRLLPLLLFLLPSLGWAYPIVTQQGTFDTELNDTSTGTTLNTLTVLNSSGKAIIAPTSTTTGILGITVAGAGIANAALIQMLGKTNCLFDNATTAGDFITASSITAGDCHDAGATAGVFTLGQVTSTHTTAGTYSVILTPIPYDLSNVLLNGSNITVANLTANGAISVTGTSTDGSDSVTNVNVNGVVNPTTYGATPFTGTLPTGTISASSTTLALSAAFTTQPGTGTDVRVGVIGAGAATSLSTPSAPTDAGSACAGTCTTSYQVKQVDIDPLDGWTAAGAAFSFSDNATLSLSAGNYLKINPSTQAGTATHAYYLSSDGGSTFTKWGCFPDATVPLYIGSNVAASNYGCPDFIPSTIPASASPQILISQVASGGGTTSLTLITPAINAATSQKVYPLSGTAINTAEAAAGTGGSLYFPGGTYYTSSQITMGQNQHWEGQQMPAVTIKAVDQLTNGPMFDMVRSGPGQLGRTLSNMNIDANYIAGGLRNVDNQAVINTITVSSAEIGPAIELKGTQNSTLSNVTAKFSLNGLLLSYNPTISLCANSNQILRPELQANSGYEYAIISTQAGAGQICYNTQLSNGLVSDFNTAPHYTDQTTDLGALMPRAKVIFVGTARNVINDATSILGITTANDQTLDTVVALGCTACVSGGYDTLSNGNLIANSTIQGSAGTDFTFLSALTNHQSTDDLSHITFSGWGSPNTIINSDRKMNVEMPVTAYYAGAVNDSGINTQRVSWIDNSGTNGNLTVPANALIANGTLNKVINPITYDAAGVTTSTTATTTASSASVTVGAATSFLANQGVRLRAQGALPSIGAVASCTVTEVGTPGAATYYYKISSVDANSGIKTAVKCSTATGNASLDSTNYENITWTGISNATFYIIWRSTNDVTYTLWQETPVFEMNDIGQSANSSLGLQPYIDDWIPALPPASDVRDSLVTKIRSISGTSITLDNAAATNASGVVFEHDDSAALRSAMTAAQAAHAALYLPNGQYNFSGAGLNQTSPNDLIVIYGDGPGFQGTFNGTTSNGAVSQVNINDGDYFVDTNIAMVTVNIHDLAFVGGLGPFRSSFTGTQTASSARTFRDLNVRNNQSAAFETNSTNEAFYNWVRIQQIALDPNGSMGIAYGGAADFGGIATISDSQFLGNRIGIKANRGMAGTSILRNFLAQTAQSGTVGPFPRIQLWIRPFTANIASRQGEIKDNQFSSENMASSDWKLAIADADSVGTDNATKMPLLSTASTGFVKTLDVEGNFFGMVAPASLPLIYSTTPNVQLIEGHNEIPSGSATYRIQFLSGQETKVVSGTNSTFLAENRTQTTSFDNAVTALQLSNAGACAGWLSDPLASNSASKTLANFGGLSGPPEASFSNLLTTKVGSFTRVGATLVGGAINDASGNGTQDAQEFLMAVGDTIAANLTGTPNDFRQGFVEFDVEAGTASPLIQIEARIDVSAGLQSFVYEFAVPASGWKTYIVPFCIPDHTLTWRMLFRNEDTVTGTGQIKIGRVRVYNSDTPVRPKDFTHYANVFLQNGGQLSSIGGTKPTVTTCGTGTVANGSTNMSGTFTMTGATACTLTFSASSAFVNAPVCLVSDETTLGGARISTAPSTASFITTATANDVIDYICIGK